jgi:hypothetical protein
MTQTVEKGSSLLSLLREEHALTMPRSWRGKSLGASSSWLLVSFLKRATEPPGSMARGIKSTHAPSHNGEGRHAPLYTRRTAGKWGTLQGNFQ